MNRVDIGIGHLWYLDGVVLAFPYLEIGEISWVEKIVDLVIVHLQEGDPEFDVLGLPHCVYAGEDLLESTR